MITFKHAAVAAAGLAMLAGTGATAQAQQKFITIGTGGVTGVYYAVGGAVCRLLNKERKTPAFVARSNRPAARLSTSTPSRPANSISAWRSPTSATTRSRGWRSSRTKSPSPNCARYTPCTPSRLPCWPERKINATKFEDLKGKRVNIGNPGSGTRASMDELLEALGWKTSDFSLASELKADEQGPALCDNKIDAFYYGVGHPSANIQDPTTSCGAKLVSLTGAAIDKLLQASPTTPRRRFPAACMPTIRSRPRPTA